MPADLFVIGIVVLFGVIGYYMGFMKSLINVASYVVSIVISFLFYPALANFLMKTELYPFISTTVNEKYISANLPSGDGDAWGVLEKYITPGIESAAQDIAASVAQLVIRIVAFVLMVIVCKLLIKLIGHLLNIFAKMPVIKQCNRFGGTVLGLATGVLVLYLFFALMVVFAPLNTNQKLMEQVNSSILASEMYENNIILNWIGGEE